MTTTGAPEPDDDTGGPFEGLCTERVTAPVYIGWDQFHAAERRLHQRGKTHARCVVLDGMNVVVDRGGHTTNWSFAALDGLAPTYQDPPKRAVLDGMRIVGWEKSALIEGETP